MTCVYILKLTNNKYYVGQTDRTIGERFQEHLNGTGSEWTKKYKPISILDVIPNADSYEEDRQTKIYMDKYGIDNVRGGSYISIILEDYQIQSLKKELCTIKNTCFTCGSTTHYVANCPNKQKNIIEPKIEKPTNRPVITFFKNAFTAFANLIEQDNNGNNNLKNKWVTSLLQI